MLTSWDGGGVETVNDGEVKKKKDERAELNEME